jgi:phosphatidylglycerophosphatase A
MSKSNKFSLSAIIATFFGVGFIPFAPGTFGSIMAFPLYALVTYMVIIAQGGVSGLASLELINAILAFIAALFFVGVWAAAKYSKDTNKEDPKEVVIDEVVGQMLTICLIIFMLPFIGHDALLKINKAGVNEFNFVMLNLLSAFILFRVFDIIKPWPISYIDQNYKNGLGIMLDDIAAAIFAVVVHFFVLFAVLDRLS